MKASMRTSTSSIVLACLFVLGCSTAALSQSVSIQRQPNPAADVVQIPKGSTENALKALPQIVADIMKRSHVPGMAVAVVSGDKTVFAKGYGKGKSARTPPSMPTPCSRSLRFRNPYPRRLLPLR